MPQSPGCVTAISGSPSASMVSHSARRCGGIRVALQKRDAARPRRRASGKNSRSNSRSSPASPQTTQCGSTRSPQWFGRPQASQALPPDDSPQCGQPPLTNASTSQCSQDAHHGTGSVRGDEVAGVVERAEELAASSAGCSGSRRGRTLTSNSTPAARHVSSMRVAVGVGDLLGAAAVAQAAPSGSRSGGRPSPVVSTAWTPDATRWRRRTSAAMYGPAMWPTCRPPLGVGGVAVMKASALMSVRARLVQRPVQGDPGQRARAPSLMHACARGCARARRRRRRAIASRSSSSSTVPAPESTSMTSSWSWTSGADEAPASRKQAIAPSGGSSAAPDHGIRRWQAMPNSVSAAAGSIRSFVIIGLLSRGAVGKGVGQDVDGDERGGALGERERLLGAWRRWR